MDREPVDSSNVADVGYDLETATLEVGFLNGSVYQYYDVPDEVYHEFMMAASKGQFVWQYLRGQYEYERVE